MTRTRASRYMPLPPPGHRLTLGSILLCIACCITSLAPVAASEVALQRALSPLLAELPANSAWSVAVYDIQRQRFVFRRNDQQQLRMASVAKLPVSAAALLELGPQYQFTTSLVSLGRSPAAHQGRIPGLGIIARGDPCLDEHHTDRQPERIFHDWIAALRAAGVTAIDGDLVVDSSYFSGPIRPATYPGGQRNIQAWYSAPASAFAWNNNCIEVQARPGSAPGQAAIIATRPHSSRIRIINRASTVASGGSAGIIVSRAANSNTISVSGQYSANSSWFPLAIHEDPDQLAADHFAHILATAGLPVTGEVRLGAVPSNAPVLHEHHSGLTGALAILNQRSHNFYGEHIIRVLGQNRYQEGSIRAGTRAVEDILAEHLDMPREHISLLDGSGLSYDNLTNTWWICQLLARMHRDPSAAIYTETLRERWESGVRCQVKTGTLAVARSLAGYINIVPDQRYAFAILLNRDEASNADWSRSTSRRDRDRILSAIVQALKDG